MKILFTTISLLALSFDVVKACSDDVPNIMLLVQSAGRGVLGTQQATEFLVPLYSDCTYKSPASPVQASGSIPTTAISANFPGDAFGFSGPDGLLLDSQSLDDFLGFLSSTIGTSIDVSAALSLVVCTVTGSDGTLFKFDDSSTYVFEGGAPVSAKSYQCEIVIGS